MTACDDHKTEAKTKEGTVCHIYAHVTYTHVSRPKLKVL